jgi:predicted DNA binding protein
MADNDCPLFLTIRVSDRSVFRRVVERHASNSDDIEIITIVDPSQEESRSLSIDVSNLTEKQWEALEIAHELGHYQTSRGGNLEEIANRLDISKSAVSQRLRAAESKIVSSILGTGPVKKTRAR